MTPAQKQFFIGQLLKKDKHQFNSVLVYEVSGELHVDRLRQAFNAVINQHQSLRTTFSFHQGQISSTLHETAELEIQLVAGTDIEVVLRQFDQHFDLRQAPLLRVSIIDITDGSRYLYLSMPHINSDWISMQLVLEEAIANYEGIGSPRNPSLQFADFDKNIAEYLNAERSKEDERFWLSHLSGYKPAVISKFSSSTQPATFVSQLKPGSAKSQTLLAAYFMLLHELTGLQDITVMVPVHNRNQKGYRKIVGLLVNAMIVRMKEINEGACLQRFTEQYMQCLSHHAYPLELLYHARNKAGEGAGALASFFFNHLTYKPTYKISEATLEFYLPRSCHEVLPLSLNIYEAAGTLMLRWQSAPGYYDAIQLQQIARQYESCLNTLFAAHLVL